MTRISEPQYEFGPFRLDAAERKLSMGGQNVKLEPKVFDLLQTLVRSSGQLLKKADLQDRVWPGVFISESGISRNISELRSTLGDAKVNGQFTYIETVHREGYRFIHAVSEVERQPSAKRVIRPIESTKAHEEYIRGRDRWSRKSVEGFNMAIMCFDRALKADTNYALAYAGLADCFHGLAMMNLAPREAFQKAREAAVKALELDAGLAEAHAVLANILFCFDRNWQGAERAFQRTIELNPEYATARQYHAFLLAAQERPDAARAEIMRAHELDPNSLYVAMDVGVISYIARSYSRAIEELSKVLEVDPHFYLARFFSGLVYGQQRIYDCAIEELKQAHQLEKALPGVNVALAALGHTYAASGRTGEAREILERLLKAPSGSYVSPCDLAVIYTALGEHDRAFEWLGRACEERDEWIVYVKVNPRLDPLRSDDRFGELVRRVGLQP